ncbi:MAG TPA: STAS domain-containing protein [Trebonia sp.]|jgi:anti-anti-sigma factor
MTGKMAGPPVIMTLPQEIDLTNSAAAAAVVLGALDAPGLVIVDMSGTTFCDTAGMRMLIGFCEDAEASQCTLRIVIKPGGSVARALAILGIDRMLPIYASLYDAMPAQLRAGQRQIS